MDIDGRINQANGRLESANVGAAIERRGNRLNIRATLPPKPGSERKQSFQQRIALGIHANPEGVKVAEREARKVGALLDCGEFDWGNYQPSKIELQCVTEWIERFEVDYFTRRQRNKKSELTWQKDYLAILKRLPDNPLTPELIFEFVASTQPDTKTRKKACIVLAAIAKFANIEIDLKPLAGSYSPAQVTPRQIPSDDLICKTYYAIEHPEWRWVFGAIAAYGLRNHEIFLLDLEALRAGMVAHVTDGKTNQRHCYPLYPEWYEEFGIAGGKPPNCSGKTHADLGHRVSQFFRRAEIPFRPYDLRHAWAVRSLEFGVDISLAAAQMGHSLRTHSEIYHHWISADVHERAFQALLKRVDRPLPPSFSP